MVNFKFGQLTSDQKKNPVPSVMTIKMCCSDIPRLQLGAQGRQLTCQLQPPECTTPPAFPLRPHSPGLLQTKTRGVSSRAETSLCDVRLLSGQCRIKDSISLAKLTTELHCSPRPSSPSLLPSSSQPRCQPGALVKAPQESPAPSPSSCIGIFPKKSLAFLGWPECWCLPAHHQIHMLKP